jgi:hypothetical protein
MRTESARMSSAAEARFRLQTTIATARAVTVVALDPAADAIVAQLAQGGWTHTAFLTTAALGRAGNLVEAFAPADLVVMISTAGADAGAAAAIGAACSQQRIMTTTVVVGTASVSDEALSKTLAQVRPWSLMVVVATDRSYVEDILRSFR